MRKLNEQWHGVTNFGPPVKHMREVVEFLRLFHKGAHLGKPIHYQGEFVKVTIDGYQRPLKPVREHIPIHLGANRPKMLELAGEVADGVLGHVFVSPRQLREEVLPAIGRGLDKAGRKREDITVGGGDHLRHRRGPRDGAPPRARAPSRSTPRSAPTNLSSLPTALPRTAPASERPSTRARSAAPSSW